MTTWRSCSHLLLLTAVFGLAWQACASETPAPSSDQSGAGGTVGEGGSGADSADASSERASSSHSSAKSSAGHGGAGGGGGTGGGTNCMDPGPGEPNNTEATAFDLGGITDDD